LTEKRLIRVGNIGEGDVGLFAGGEAQTHGLGSEGDGNDLGFHLGAGAASKDASGERAGPADREEDGTKQSAA
jgi:hypothetical protein